MEVRRRDGGSVARVQAAANLVQLLGPPVIMRSRAFPMLCQCHGIEAETRSISTGHIIYSHRPSY